MEVAGGPVEVDAHDLGLVAEDRLRVLHDRDHRLGLEVDLRRRHERAVLREDLVPAGLVGHDLGERRLERAFRDRVGVSPKRLARILRFRSAYVALARGGAQAAVAFDAGYADQAHLLRDFRELAGAPPSQVLGRVSDSSNPDE